MTDIVWPSDLAPFSVSFYSQPYSGGTQSPFTRQTKTYGLAAPRWIAKLQFRGGVDGSDGIEAFGPRIDALLAQIRGSQNRVALFDWRRPEVRGAAYGHVVTVLNAAAKGDVALTLAGLPVGQTAFLVGDNIGFADHLLLMAITEPVADGSGHVTVNFEPPLKRAVEAGEALVISEPRAWFKLQSDDGGDAPAVIGQPVVYTLEFAEDL